MTLDLEALRAKFDADEKHAVVFWLEAHEARALLDELARERTMRAGAEAELAEIRTELSGEKALRAFAEHQAHHRVVSLRRATFDALSDLCEMGNRISTLEKQAECKHPHTRSTRKARVECISCRFVLETYDDPEKAAEVQP